MAGTKVNINLGGPIMFLVGFALVIMKAAGIEPIAGLSWWLVTLPWWIGIAIMLFMLGVAAVIGLITLLGAGVIFWLDARRAERVRKLIRRR